MMRRTINLLLMLLFVAEVTSANTVDFDKAFKESARIRSWQSGGCYKSFRHYAIRHEILPGA